MNRGFAALFVLIWSSGFVAAGIGTREVAPLTLSTWRFVLAGTVLTVIALCARSTWPRDWRSWREASVIGVLLQGAHFATAYVGMASGVSAGVVALVICSSPVLVAVAAGPVLGERLNRVGWVGAVTALLGMLIAGLHHLRSGAGSVGGLAFVGASAVLLAGGTLLQKKRGTAVALLPSAAIQAAVSAVVVAGTALLVDGHIGAPATATGVGAIVWISLVCSVAGVVILFVLLRRAPGTAVSGLMFIVPPATALLAVPVLGQPLEAPTMTALVLSVAGVVLVDRSARASAAEPVIVGSATPMQQAGAPSAQHS